MVFTTTNFPSYPEESVFISLFTDVDGDTLETVKTKLIEGDKSYDFAFLNCHYIISKEHILSAIYRAVTNYKLGINRTKSLNTEIIFNLSPTQNITDALRRFGVDSSKSHNHLLCIKVLDKESLSPESINNQLMKVLKVEPDQNPELSDDFLLTCVDISKFKKLYKLNDAKLVDDKPLNEQLTRLAIGTCLLRGV